MLIEKMYCNESRKSLSRELFHLFLELGKIEKSFKSNIQKSKNLFLNLEKLEF